MSSVKKLFSFLLLLLFLAGIAPLSPLGRSPAEARAKKKVRRIVRRTKKIVRKVKRPVIRKVKRPKAIKKPVAKKIKDSLQYDLPARTGMVTQKYSLEEGIGDADAGNVVGELKALGVADAAVNAGQNTVTVQFNSSELSSVGIIKKLRELGYTVKRIN